VPALPPVTTPLVATAAMEGDAELHTPPAVASLSEVVAPPAHTEAAPPIAAGIEGKGFTVTTIVAAAAPQLFASV